MKDSILLAKAVNCDPTAIIGWWDCTINTNALLGVKQSGDTRNDPNLFVQDVFLGATFFIWTLVTIALVWSGLRLIFVWGTDAKAAADAKKGIQYALIGLVLVIFSYTIVRVVQYIVWGRI